MSLTEQETAEVRFWAEKFWAKMRREPPRDAVTLKADMLYFGGMLVAIYGREVLEEMRIQLRATAPVVSVLKPTTDGDHG